MSLSAVCTLVWSTTPATLWQWVLIPRNPFWSPPPCLRSSRRQIRGYRPRVQWSPPYRVEAYRRLVQNRALLFYPLGWFWMTFSWLLRSREDREPHVSQVPLHALLSG